MLFTAPRNLILVALITTTVVGCGQGPSVTAQPASNPSTTPTTSSSRAEVKPTPTPSGPVANAQDVVTPPQGTDAQVAMDPNAPSQLAGNGDLQGFSSPEELAAAKKKAAENAAAKNILLIKALDEKGSAQLVNRDSVEHAPATSEEFHNALNTTSGIDKSSLNTIGEPGTNSTTSTSSTSEKTTDTTIMEGAPVSKSAEQIAFENHTGVNDGANGANGTNGTAEASASADAMPAPVPAKTIDELASTISSGPMPAPTLSTIPLIGDKGDKGEHGDNGDNGKNGVNACGPDAHQSVGFAAEEATNEELDGGKDAGFFANDNLPLRTTTNADAKKMIAEEKAKHEKIEGRKKASPVGHTIGRIRIGQNIGDLVTDTMVYFKFKFSLPPSNRVKVTSASLSIHYYKKANDPHPETEFITFLDKQILSGMRYVPSEGSWLFNDNPEYKNAANSAFGDHILNAMKGVKKRGGIKKGQIEFPDTMTITLDEILANSQYADKVQDYLYDGIPVDQKLVDRVIPVIVGDDTYVDHATLTIEYDMPCPDDGEQKQGEGK